MRASTCWPSVRDRKRWGVMGPMRPIEGQQGSHHAPWKLLSYPSRKVAAPDVPRPHRFPAGAAGRIALILPDADLAGRARGDADPAARARLPGGGPTNGPGRLAWRR